MHLLSSYHVYPSWYTGEWKPGLCPPKGNQHGKRFRTWTSGDGVLLESLCAQASFGSPSVAVSYVCFPRFCEKVEPWGGCAASRLISAKVRILWSLGGEILPSNIKHWHLKYTIMPSQSNCPWVIIFTVKTHDLVCTSFFLSLICPHIIKCLF